MKDKKKKKDKKTKKDKKHKIKDNNLLIKKNEKYTICTVIFITCLLFTLTLIYRNLIFYDYIVTLLSIIFLFPLIYFVYIDNRFFIDLIHFYIAILFVLSTYFNDKFLLLTSLLASIFTQIQWKIFDKCILFTCDQVSNNEYYGINYITEIGILFVTIILSYKLGR